MVTERETARVLGILEPAMQSPLWIVDQVSRGLPLSTLERVVDQVAPGDKTFVFRFISKATLARRRKPAPASHHLVAAPSPRAATKASLSPEESAKVARLAEVWALARDVWGSDEDARAFLFRPHAMLEGKNPIDVVLSNEFGRPLVEGILGRLRHGSAA